MEHGLHLTKKTVEEVVPKPKKTEPSWDLLIFALASATSNEDQHDIKGQKSLANSLVGGDINARKTRIMNFVRAENIFQANSVPVFIKRNHVRLVMCERAKDGMVDAVVQFHDDQEDDDWTNWPHDVLPSLCNTHFADRLAEQFRALMEKDGYKLVEDKIQPIQQREQSLTPNASTHPIAVGASAPGNDMNQLPNSPHMNQLNSQIQILQQQQRRIQMLQQQLRQQDQQLQSKMLIPGGLSSSVDALEVGSVNYINRMSGVGMPVSGCPQGGLNVVGLNRMSSVVSMESINSPSMGSMPHLANINNSVFAVGGIGQNSIVNMMGQHIGPSIPYHAEAFANKLRMSQVRGLLGTIRSPAMRNTIENNITEISASNQADNSEIWELLDSNMVEEI